MLQKIKIAREKEKEPIINGDSSCWETIQLK